MIRLARPTGYMKNGPSLRRSIQTFDNLVSDINITQSGKTIIASGAGGRSSRTGYTATVFGASGLLGTQLVAKLARHGTITVVPFREEMKNRHLKVTGDLGVVNYLEFDLRNIKSIEDSVKHSDIVYNLVGRNYATKNFSFNDVHVEGAKRIAEAVAKYNVSRFIHVSSHSADSHSTSEFFKTKGLGEETVRDIIPDVTIVRPGPMFGNGDKFVNKIAAAKLLLTSNNSKELIRPTFVGDVALALEKIGFDDSTAGKTYELNGPKEYSLKQVIDLIRNSTFNDIRELNLPKGFYQYIANLTNKFIYWETTSPDQIERMFIDQVVNDGTLGLESLGIKPTELSEVITHLVRHHRSYLYTRDNLETDAKRRKEREYIRIIH